MPELRELKKKGNEAGPQNKPNKLLIGLLSLLVFTLLFVFFRDKDDVFMDSDAPVIDAPSSEGLGSISDNFPLDPIDESNEGDEGSEADVEKALTGGRVRIGSEGEGSEQLPSSRQEEKIIPIPKEDLAFFDPLPNQDREKVEVASSQAKAPPSARVSPKTDTTVYTIQLGAFKDKKKADILAIRLRKGGYEAYLLAESGQLYRVRVGEYQSRKAAQKVADQIRKSERLDSFITKDE